MLGGSQVRNGRRGIRVHAHVDLLVLGVQDKLLLKFLGQGRHDFGTNALRPVLWGVMHGV